MGPLERVMHDFATRLSKCKSCKHTDPAGELGCKCKRNDCVCNIANQKWG